MVAVTIIILFFIFSYNLARGGLCIADWFVPGLNFSDDKPLYVLRQNSPLFLNNWDHMAKGLLANEILIAEHLSMLFDVCFYYYDTTKFSDIYHYFRHDFIKWNHFAAVKFIVFCGIVFLPLAIYESYEYGFPKEYFYVIPAAIYSAFLWYFCGIYFEVTINFVQNSWFLNELYDVPEIDIWLEFLYINKNESYIVTKTRHFYYYLFIIESISIPEIQSWEDFVYFDEDNRKSLIITFYKKYLWWLTPRPKYKLKWPRWR